MISLNSYVPLPQNLITSCSLCLLPILEKDTPLLLRLHCCLCSYGHLLNVWLSLYLPNSMSTQLVSSWSPFLQGWAQGLVHCQHSGNVVNWNHERSLLLPFPRIYFMSFYLPSSFLFSPNSDMLPWCLNALSFLWLLFLRLQTYSPLS